MSITTALNPFSAKYCRWLDFAQEFQALGF